MREAFFKRPGAPSSEKVGRFKLRVYYEDTDFSGFVYHASYLRFLERARTEWLRALGFAQGQLKSDGAVTFAVRRLTIDYLKPAAIDDELLVETRVRRLGGASIDFEQGVLRGGERLASALVSVAMLRNRRPGRIPSPMRKKLLEAAGLGSEPSVPAHLQRPVQPRDD